MSSSTNQNGVFTISLDFELYWGVRDLEKLESYRERLQQTRIAIPKLLESFHKFGVQATWATVGLLFLNDESDLYQHLPKTLPGYTDANLCPFEYSKENQLEPFAHFAPKLIDLIKSFPGQEIGCHSYSHFYCLEEGVHHRSFEADLKSATTVAERQEIDLRSYVFPRNQWNKRFIDSLRNSGFTSFRGTEKHPIYDATKWEGQNIVRRAIRLLDAYVNLTGHHTFRLHNGERPINLRASRFLRPYSQRLRWLEPLKLRRIKKAMDKAARDSEVFHLWWHPHNFGANSAENLEGLEEILRHYSHLKEQYGFQSLNMGNLAESVSR